MDDRRSRYVTQRLPQLQGLVIIPLAAVCLAWFVWRAGWIRLPWDTYPLASAWWMGLALGVPVALARPIRNWYRNRFRGGVTQWISGSPLAWFVVVFACMPVAAAIQEEWSLHFSLPMAVIAAAVAIVGIRHYPLRRHYLGAAAVLLGYVLLPALGVPPGVRHILFPAAIGIAIAVAAFGDHRLIATTMTPLNPDEKDPADV